MHQLVVDDVIPHKVGRLHQPPVERDRAAGRARTPARALVADGDVADFDAGFGREFPGAGGQLDARPAGDLRLERRTQIAVEPRHAEHVGAQADHRPPALRRHADRLRLAPPEHGCAGCPHLGGARPGLVPRPGALQPGAVLLDEPPRLALRAVPRNGGHGDAVAPQREPVMAGARAADKPDLGLRRPGRGLKICRRFRHDCGRTQTFPRKKTSRQFSATAGLGRKLASSAPMAFSARREGAIPLPGL